jgi:hypothetical protein
MDRVLAILQAAASVLHRLRIVADRELSGRPHHPGGTRRPDWRWVWSGRSTVLGGVESPAAVPCLPCEEDPPRQCDRCPTPGVGPCQHERVEPRNNRGREGSDPCTDTVVVLVAGSGSVRHYCGGHGVDPAVLGTVPSADGLIGGPDCSGNPSPTCYKCPYPGTWKTRGCEK